MLNLKLGKTLIVSLLILFNAAFSYSQCSRMTDSLELINLYEQLDGSEWNYFGPSDTPNKGSEWDFAVPIDSWHGVRLNQKGCVQSLHMTHITNGGTLESLHLLELDTLKLADNGFSGSIDSLILSPSLKVLDVSYNNLQGSINNIFNAYQELKVFDANFTPLSGIVQEDLYELDSLEILQLYSQDLSGSLSPRIGELTKLKYLGIVGNLTGEIPAEIGSLDSLVLLNFGANELSGEIPSTIGNLKNLEYLYLSSNLLSGSIPEEIGNLTNLIELGIRRNELSGNLPSSLGNLIALNVLELSDNSQLSGVIPTEIGDLKNIRSIRIINCDLQGQLPASLFTLPNLSTLLLKNNQLSGEIPQDLSLLTNINTLDLSFNNLSGNIPTAFGERIAFLYLRNNNFTGNIPATLANYPWFRQIRLSKNRLSGNIPPELGTLDLLNDLALFSNLLTGCVPEELLPLCERITLNRNPDLWSDNPELPWSGSARNFCEEIQQIGAPCLKDGEPGIIDEDCSCQRTVSTSETDQSPISIFPNPTSGLLNISGIKEYQVELKTIGGQLILRRESSPDKIDISYLAQGIYIVKINDGKNVHSQLIFKI